MFKHAPSLCALVAVLSLHGCSRSGFVLEVKNLPADLIGLQIRAVPQPPMDKWLWDDRIFGIAAMAEQGDYQKDRKFVLDLSERFRGNYVNISLTGIGKNGCTVGQGNNQTAEIFDPGLYDSYDSAPNMLRIEYQDAIAKIKQCPIFSNCPSGEWCVIPLTDIQNRPASWATPNWYTIWGSSSDPSNVWIFGQNGDAVHYENCQFVYRNDMAGSGKDIHAVGGASENDIWAGNDMGELFHYEEETFGGQRLFIKKVSQLAGSAILGIFGLSGPADYWALGTGCAVSHYDGKKWEEPPSGPVDNPKSICAKSGSPQFLSIGGPSQTNIWLIGELGNGFQYDGNGWRGRNINVNSKLRKGIWAPLGGWNVIWAVGEQSGIDGYDGFNWNPARSSPSPATTLNAVWGCQRVNTGDANLKFSDLWVVGDGGFIQHYDSQKQTWLDENENQKIVSAKLNAIWGEAEWMWAVGDNGTILVRRP